MVLGTAGQRCEEEVVHNSGGALVSRFPVDTGQFSQESALATAVVVSLGKCNPSRPRLVQRDALSDQKCSASIQDARPGLSGRCLTVAKQERPKPRRDCHTLFLYGTMTGGMSRYGTGIGGLLPKLRVAPATSTPSNAIQDSLPPAFLFSCTGGTDCLAKVIQWVQRQ